MDAATFEGLFVEHVLAPASTVGFERWGKGLFFEDPTGWRAAVVRTEGYNLWPFRLTMVIGHAGLRDFEDVTPAPKRQYPSEWPIKLAPSAAGDLLKRRWRYRPYNTGLHGWPGDTFADDTAARQLQQIGRALGSTFPAVVDALTPSAIRKQIAKRGEDAWCERRWIEDYDKLGA